MTHHQLEDRIFPCRQLDGLVPAIDEPRRPVDGDVPDDEHWSRVAAGAPHEGAQARDELGYGKRLGQVIVGAKIERPDAIVDAVERSEDKDRRPRAGRGRPPEQDLRPTGRA
jgi:hypothetical protein